MFIIALLIAAFNLASSAPVTSSTTDFGAAASATIFGRELPDCANVARYRTIQDIVWSCLATIFACTWVAVHQNVPRPADSKWKKFRERVLVMVYAILAPEFVIGWALLQWRGAARNAARYNEKHHGMAPPSSYFRWYIKCCTRQSEKPGLWTITHGFLLEMHGLVEDSGELIHSVDKILDPLDISEEEIGDKSKGDFLTKLLVVLQTTWFIFQCFTRWAQHLPVTELEVVTLAFAFLNICTYALWWNKPQGMGLAIQMDRYKRPKNNPQEQKEATEGDEGDAIQGTPSEAQPEEDMDDVVPLLAKPTQRSGFPGRAAEVVKQLVSRSGVLDIIEIIVDIIIGVVGPLCAMLFHDEDEQGNIFYSSYEENNALLFYLVIISTMFGGLHLIPLWTSSFPSSSEKLLWKICAILITIQPFLLLYLGATLNKSERHAAFSYLFAIYFVVSLLSYVIARIILVIIAFTTLRDLPPGVFRNIAWTTYIPHI